MSSTVQPPTVVGGDLVEEPTPVDLTKAEVEDQAAEQGTAPATGLGALMEKARQKATGAFAEGGPVRAHFTRAGENTKAWLGTADLTDADLVAEIVRQHALTHQQRETELRRQLAQVSSQIIAAKRTEVADTRTNDDRRDGEQVALLKGRRELIQTQLTEHQELVQESAAPTPAAIGRARWGRKAGRAAMLVASVIGGGIVLPLQDVRWLLAALPAAAVALWRAGALAEDDTESVPAEQAPAEADRAPAHAAAVTPAAGVPVALEDLVRTEPETAPPSEVEQASHTWLMDRLLEATIVTAESAKRTKVISMLTQGPGWTATVELAPGKKATDAISKAGELASALGRKSSQIEMAVDSSAEGHDGRVTMWVSDKANPYDGRPVTSQLVDAESWDFWSQGVPLGADARGVRKVLDLLWSSLMVGGLQRYGKTYMVRLVAAAAALDPYVRIVLVSGKTSPDWLALKLVADKWVVGQTPSKVREAYETIEWAIEELQQRGEALTELAEKDPQAVPEGKLTRELARDPRFGITLLIIDELQNLLVAAASVKSGPRPNDPAYASMIRASIGVFNRMTSSQGGIAVAVVHRPGPDSPVTPDLRDSFVCRASYRVKGIDSARNTLGPDAVADGAAPHALLEVHKGVAVVDLGEDGGHFTMKADVITLDEFADICARGRELRIAAGTLTGYAAESVQAEQADTARRSLLTAVIDAMAALGTDGARLDELAAQMAETDPERWSELTPEQLGDLLRTNGAGTTVKLPRREDGSRPNGYRLEAVQAALKGEKAA